MLLLTFSPLHALSPYIDRIFVQEDLKPTNFANRNPVKVLPTTMTVMGIQYGQAMYRLENNETFAMGSSGITGMHATVKEYIGTGAIGTIIIQFKPGGLTQFTPYPIHEFQNADVPLDTIFPPQSVREMEERLSEASDATQRVGVVQQFLLSMMRHKEDEHTILQAAHHITRQKGAVSIERLAAQSYMSKRTLERKFNLLIGASPKQFANIVRFQHAIQLHNAGYSYLDIVHACGYSDHAHFVKAFKAFAGSSPEQFFRSEFQPELKQTFQSKEPPSDSHQHMYY